MQSHKLSENLVINHKGKHIVEIFRFLIFVWLAFTTRPNPSLSGEGLSHIIIMVKKTTKKRSKSTLYTLQVLAPLQGREIEGGA